MVAEENQSLVKTLHAVKEVLIAAPPDVVGQILLGVGSVMMVIGFFMIQKIVDIKV